MSKKFFSDRDTAGDARAAKLAKSAAEAWLFDRELVPGETVLWTGRPKRGVFFVLSDFLLIPIALLAGWFALLMASWAMEQPYYRYQPMWFLHPRFLIMLTLFGMLMARLVIDPLYRSRLTYVVTNRRVMLHIRILGLRVRSVEHKILVPRLFEFSDGRGTIFLVPRGSWSKADDNTPWRPAFFAKPMLFRIKNARQIYELLQHARA